MSIQCPECETTYKAGRCGLHPEEGKALNATIGCMVCKQTFDVSFAWAEAVPGVQGAIPGWFARVVLRTKATPHTPPIDGQHRVTTRIRKD